MISKLDQTSNDYVIVTDAGCDLPKTYMEAEGIKCIPLYFYFENDEIIKNNDEMSVREFYAKIKAGEVAKTSAPNPDIFADIFREILEKGKDILYIGLDSALSTTFNSGRLAADLLLEDYPERSILCLDSLCASAGQGMLVAMASQKKAEGYTLQQAYDFASELIPQIAHRFTVETLTYLCRGGRISKSAAMAGNILNIKPVLHVDDEGHLISLTKARGRAKSLSMLLDAYEETAVFMQKSSSVAVGAEDIDLGDTGMASDNDMIMISHADCREEAEKLAETIKTRFHRNVDLICDIGPVIGSHAGPGTIALFFVATTR